MCIKKCTVEWKHYYYFLHMKITMTSWAALVSNSLFSWGCSVLSDLSNFGWWVTMLVIMGDHPWEAGRQYLGGWFWIMGDKPKADRWPSRGCWLTILSLGWWVTIQGMVLTVHGSCHLVLILWLSLCAKLQVCSTPPSVRFWMVGNHPLVGGWPSWWWWLTIHNSCHLVLILWVKSRCQIPCL